jgi:hypothetical protein
MGLLQMMHWFLACVLLGLQQMHEQVSSHVLSTERNWKLGRWCKVAACLMQLSMTSHSCLCPAGVQQPENLVAFFRLACLHFCPCNLAGSAADLHLRCFHCCCRCCSGRAASTET